MKVNAYGAYAGDKPLEPIYKSRAANPARTMSRSILPIAASVTRTCIRFGPNGQARNFRASPVMKSLVA